MVDYRKLIVDSALSYVGTKEPSGDDQFIRAYNKWANANFSIDTTPWCAIFITFNGRMVGVPTNIIPNFASCKVAIDWYKQRGQWYDRTSIYKPKGGDLCFFDWQVDKKADHVGIVIETDGSKVYVVEGNTKGSGAVYGVFKKSYMLSSKYILGYASPDYTGKSTTGISNPTQLSGMVKTSYIRKFQTWLNKNYGFSLIVDGSFGPKTRKASIMAWQMQMNASFITCKLEVDGSYGPLSKKQCDVHPLKKNSKYINLVYILQGLLYAHGYDPKGFDGIFGTGCQAAIRAFQRARSINEADVVKAMTMEFLFNK